MSRYVDADCIPYSVMRDFDGKQISITTKDRVDKVPTADVAPVIHCAECKFFNRDDATTDGKCRCEVDKLWQSAFYQPYRKFDDFCSRGAKMDEEEE